MGLFELLYSSPWGPWLGLLQTAFMVWMLVDAYRRGADWFWMLLIFFVPFFGAWAYFFLVKVQAGDLHRLGLGRVGSFFHRGPSLAQLRYVAEQTPTLTNHVNLADKLIEHKRYAEAASHLEAALKTEPDLGRALYALALCYKEEGRPREAAALLERLLKRDPRWSHYLGWRLLIESRAAAGDGAGALDGCKELARLAPSLENQCLLADNLLEQGQPIEARELLERALREYDYAPGPSRRRNSRWAAEARRLLKQTE
jgi:hypothetical protein